MIRERAEANIQAANPKEPEPITDEQRAENLKKVREILTSFQGPMKLTAKDFEAEKERQLKVLKESN